MSYSIFSDYTGAPENIRRALDEAKREYYNSLNKKESVKEEVKVAHKTTKSHKKEKVEKEAKIDSVKTEPKNDKVEPNETQLSSDLIEDISGE